MKQGLTYTLRSALGILLLALLLGAGPATAQAAKTANFQMHLTDSSGQSLAKQSVKMLVELTRERMEGQTQYAETHAVNTNAEGNVAFVIGGGTPTDPKYVFDNFDIAQGDNFIRVSIEEAGTWRLLLSSQLPHVSDMRGWLFADEKHNTVVAIMVAVWLGIVVYLLLAGQKMRRLEKQVAELKQKRAA